MNLKPIKFLSKQSLIGLLVLIIILSFIKADSIEVNGQELQATLPHHLTSNTLISKIDLISNELLKELTQSTNAKQLK